MIRDENYIMIPGWARNKLGLKGNELIIFSLIHGFSQDGESEFKGSLSYIEEWSGATRPTVIKSLKALEDKGLIIKREIPVANHLKLTTYRVDIEAVKKFNRQLNKTYTGSKETLPGQLKNFTGGSKETLPNNINNNLNNNISNSIGKFAKPTIEEIKEYCLLRKNNVDPERFFNYYESNGWKVGKNPMKNWKAAVITWERGSYTKPVEQKKNNAFHNFEQRSYDYDALERLLTN